MKKFYNENRTRYYGLRIGDTVEYKSFIPNVPNRVGIVTRYGFMDNNKVEVLFEDNNKKENVVAEWCLILKKVEDEK